VLALPAYTDVGTAAHNIPAANIAAIILFLISLILSVFTFPYNASSY
jgi:hypothetical protein